MVSAGNSCLLICNFVNNFLTYFKNIVQNKLKSTEDAKCEKLLLILNFVDFINPICLVEKCNSFHISISCVSQLIIDLN